MRPTGWDGTLTLWAGMSTRGRGFWLCKGESQSVDLNLTIIFPTQDSVLEKFNRGATWSRLQLGAHLEPNRRLLDGRTRHHMKKIKISFYRAHRDISENTTLRKYNIKSIYCIIMIWQRIQFDTYIFKVITAGKKNSPSNFFFTRIRPNQY